MIGATITKGKDLGRKLRIQAGTLRTHMVQDVERCVRIYEREVKQGGLTGAKGRDPFWGVTGAKGDTLGARTGLTRASVQGTVFTTGGGAKVWGVVGSPSKTLLAHEEGAPGSGKVRIPTRWAQTGAGVDIYAGQSVRGIPGLFPVRLGHMASRTSGFWIARSKGLKGKGKEDLVLMYLIRQAKDTPARHPLKAALARVRPQLSAVMSYTAQVWAMKANHLEAVS